MFCLPKTAWPPTLSESRQVHPRPRFSRETVGAANPRAAGDLSRIDDLEGSGSGRFASAPLLVSAQPSEPERPGSPTTNRPPETLRAGSGADAATDTSERVASENSRLRPDVSLERTSAQLGAECVEARAARLLQGAGADVTARDVRERSGAGSPLARMLLEKALTSVRTPHQQHTSSIVQLRRRSSTRSLS